MATVLANPGGLDRQRALAARVAAGVAGVLFAALIIGDRPFAPDVADKAAAVEGGNAFNRLAIFAAFVSAVPLLLTHLERALRILLRNWPGALLVLWSGVSFAWASHPDLVLRRALAMALVYLAFVGLAAAARSADDWLVPLASVFAVVTVLNVVAMLAFPAASWSEIGETGIFDNKNGAGTMAMLAIVVLGTALAAARRLTLRLGLLGTIGLAWVFLLATRSKTSIGVAAGMTVAAPVLYLVLSSGWPTRLAVASGAVGLGIFAAIVYVGAGHDDADLRLLLFGDLTFTGRTEIWTHLLPEIARRPWLGHGFGSFWDVGARVNPILSAPPEAWFMNAQLINTAHNGYLDVLLQTGLVGFVLAVAAILRCLWLLTAGAAAGSRAERVAMTGALCVAICLVLNNFLESYLFRTGDALGYLFAFTMLHGEAAHLRQEAGETRAASPAGAGP